MIKLAEENQYNHWPDIEIRFIGIFHCIEFYNYIKYYISINTYIIQNVTELKYIHITPSFGENDTLQLHSN